MEKMRRTRISKCPPAPEINALTRSKRLLWRHNRDVLRRALYADSPVGGWGLEVGGWGGSGG